MFVLVLSLIILAYTYFGYALLIYVLLCLGVKRRQEKGLEEISQSECPEVSVIITVHNEAPVLRDKLANTLALAYPREKLQIILASDASSDESWEIAREYSAMGVEWVENPERQGKEAAQAVAAERARGEILVFTDAKISLEEGAIKGFVKYFADPLIGAVSSYDVLEASPGASRAEGIYVRYEMWLRSLESRFNSLVGLSGSCFAVRRTLSREIIKDLPSDFVLQLAAIERGYIGVQAEDVKARYSAAKSESAEFKRKLRTVTRGLNALLTFKRLLYFKNCATNPIFSWQLISHKLLRWLQPFFLLALFFSTLELSFRETAFAWLLVLEVSLMLLAISSILLPAVKNYRLPRLAGFVLLSNTAIILAWWNVLRGKKKVTWAPTAR